MRRIGNLFRGGRRDGGGRCQASRLARRALCTAGTAALLLAVLATPATAGAGDPDGDRRPVQVVTIAGTGELGFSGDGGDALDARLNRFLKLDVDSQGNVYMADSGNGRVRAVSPDGAIDTVPGTRGQRAPENDGPDVGGSSFSPSDKPQSVAVGDDDTLYVAADESIRRRDADGRFTVITTSDGEADFFGGEGGGDGGPASEAFVYGPGGTAVDAAGNLYIADSYNSRIRKVAPDGTISTIAGTGEPRDEGDGGPATDAGLTEPRDIAVDADGTIYVVSSRSERVRRIDPDGTITTINEIGSTGAGDAGGEAHGDDERATDVELDGPEDIAVDGDGNLYLVDGSRSAFSGGAVRRVDGDGSIASVEADRAGERFGLVPEIGYLSACAIGAGGRLYVAANGVVQRRDPEDNSTTVAGRDQDEPIADEDVGRGDGGPARDAVLTDPSGLAVAADGTIYVSERAGIRRIDPGGTISTIFESPTVGDEGEDGSSATATSTPPAALAVAADGNLYFADQSTHQVRVIVQPADIPVPASSRWGTVVRASVILVSLVLGAVGLWRRRQLADLVRGRRQSAGADDGAQA